MREYYFFAFIHTVVIIRNNMVKARQSQQIMLIVHIGILLVIILGRKMPSAGNTDAEEILRSCNALKVV